MKIPFFRIFRPKPEQVTIQNVRITPIEDEEPCCDPPEVIPPPEVLEEANVPEHDPYSDWSDKKLTVRLAVLRKQDEKLKARIRELERLIREQVATWRGEVQGWQQTLLNQIGKDMKQALIGVSQEYAAEIKRKMREVSDQIDEFERSAEPDVEE